MSAEPPPPRPSAARQTLGILAGMGATLAMHVLAFIVVMMIASMVSTGEGEVAALMGFLFLIGIAQWAYVAPAALISKRMGLPALAKGFWIGGALGTLLTALCWGGMGVTALAALVSNALPKPAATAPPVTESALRVLRGTIKEVQGDRVWIQEDGDGVHVVQLRPAMEITLLKKGGGYVDGDRRLLVPGARVVVDASPAGDVFTALIFRVQEAGD